MVLDRPWSLEAHDVHEPVAGPDEVVVEVSACGICRTDLQIVSGDLPARKSRLVPGHQVVGRRVDTGERVGVAWLHSACGHCEYCLSGRENLCELAAFTGWTVDGGYAERLVARQGFVFPIPDRFDDLDAAPLLCAGIIGYRSLRLSGIREGQRLGLFGFGSSAHLAIQGGSNGGLLMGAAFTQRPDLFRAVVCQVPLLDMLRYQHFQIAKLWIPEYGTADDAAQFKFIHAYSPYHHVKPGTLYPAILFMTAESDTRVDPLHALKMAALLQTQASNGDDRPILLRVDSKAGHGVGKPITKLVDDAVDVWSFLFSQLGVKI